MKTVERYLWIAGILLAGFVVQGQFNNNANLETLLVTYEVESKIQDAQINDFSVQLNTARDSSYSKGFEDGRTQAGVALAQGGSLYNYTDGYHAAMSQIKEDAALDVSKALLTELNHLRKMVPRLLNQVEQITKEKEALKAESDIWAMLLDDLGSEESADEIYLEIIEFLAEARDEYKEE